MHSVLWLILAFFNAAGLMVLVGAEFIAMLLVIVYVGAVAVLFLFVVMMLDIDFAELRAGFIEELAARASPSRWSCWPRWCSRSAPATPGAIELGTPTARPTPPAPQHPGDRRPALHALSVHVRSRRARPAGGDDRRDRADPPQPPRRARRRTSSKQVAPPAAGRDAQHAARRSAQGVEL